MNNNLFTGTILKSMDILDCFESDEDEFGIKELSEAVDLPESSVYRIVQSLEYIGLLMQDDSNRKYRLGTKLHFMSERMKSFDSAMELIGTSMQELSDEIEENVNLGTLSGNHLIMVNKIECANLLRPNYLLGVGYPAHRTSLGKVLLSEVSRPVLRYIHAANEIEQPFAEFEKSLAEVKKQGFALDDEELSAGLRCVSAPIRIFKGKPLYAISVSGPTIRMTDEKFAKAKALVIKHAARISEELSAQGLFLAT